MVQEQQNKKEQDIKHCRKRKTWQKYFNIVALSFPIVAYVVFCVFQFKMMGFRRNGELMGFIDLSIAFCAVPTLVYSIVTVFIKKDGWNTMYSTLSILYGMVILFVLILRVKNEDASRWARWISFGSLMVSVLLMCIDTIVIDYRSYKKKEAIDEKKCIEVENSSIMSAHKTSEKSEKKKG